MKVNEKNMRVYDEAFVKEDGSLGSWFPGIDEGKITEHKEEDGHWVPATPLGYRDYKESRKEGLENIFLLSEDHEFTLEDLKKTKKGEEGFCLYDHLLVSGKDHYVVSGEGDDRFFLTTPDDQTYYIPYVN